MSWTHLRRNLHNNKICKGANNFETICSPLYISAEKDTTDRLLHERCLLINFYIYKWKNQILICFCFFFSLFHWIKFINLRKFRNQIFMNINLRHAPAEVHFSVNSMSWRCELWNSVFTKYLIKNTNQHTHKHILGDRIFLNCSAWKTLVIFFSRYVVLLYHNSLTLFKKKKKACRDRMRTQSGTLDQI